MRTIHKFPFEIADDVTVRMPGGARILKVECQGDTPCIWAIVDTSREKLQRHFQIFGTGHEVGLWASEKTHIATFQQGQLVWHMFEPYSVNPR